MRFLVFGSLNIDHVYEMPHLVREGETVAARGHKALAGGKGLNQAIALSRAGASVHFAGAVGEDGAFLKRMLEDGGVDAQNVRTLACPSGHAVIQVDECGRNAIIIYGGANREITPEMIDETLFSYGEGDWLLMQNEISCGEYLLKRAAERGLRVVLNPSPISRDMLSWPIEQADMLIFNEIEGCELTGRTEPDEILDALLARCPKSRLVLTLGENGAICADGERRLRQSAFPVKAVDTTAAGDTFTGYFLAAIAQEVSPAEAMKPACAAAAIAVSRPGATPSIPMAEEVKRMLEQGGLVS